MIASTTKTRTYAADDGAFPNAQIGYAPMIDTAEAGDATLRYLELTWREAEPEEGVYAWETISEKYGFAALRGAFSHCRKRSLHAFPSGSAFNCKFWCPYICSTDRICGNMFLNYIISSQQEEGGHFFRKNKFATAP